MIYACISYVSCQAAAVSQLSIWLDHMVTSWQQWHNLPCLPCFIYVEMCLSVLYLSFLFYHTCYCWSILPRISHPWQQWHNLPCLPCFIYVETGLPVLCLIFLFYHTCYCWSPLPRISHPDNIDTICHGYRVLSMLRQVCHSYVWFSYFIILIIADHFFSE